MAANYRYWCGECRYRTSWLTESQGAEQQERHYTERHPGLLPGGRVEVDPRKGGGGGCIAVVGVLLLLVLFARSCQNTAESQSRPVRAEHGIAEVERR